MLGTGLRFWTTLLLASSLLTGCASYYRLEVGGDKADLVHSVFLIVAKEDPLRGGNVEASSLIRPDKISQYLAFAQFDPAEGDPLRWQEVTLESKFDLITVTRSDDQRVLTLRIDKELLEENKQLTVVAVGHGADRWYAEPVDAPTVRLQDGVRFDAGSSQFARRSLK